MQLSSDLVTIKEYSESTGIPVERVYSLIKTFGISARGQRMSRERGAPPSIYDKLLLDKAFVEIAEFQKENL